MRQAAATTRAAVASMGTAMTAGITAPFAGAGVMAVSAAAQMEQAQVQFSTMLQSEAKGMQMVKDLIQFAAATPLTTPEVTTAARTLLQFGVEGERVIETLRMLGDAAGGDSQRFQSMSLAFGQMSAAGRLMGQDLLQMINAGFNPLQEISRTTGKSMGQLKKEMEDGKISAAMVTAAFRSATSQGGRFFNMMEKQSQTVTGLWSTMRDNASLFLVTLGDMIIKQLHVKDAIKAVSAAAGDVGNWLKSLSPMAQKAMLAVALIASTLGPLLIVLSAVGPAVVAGFGLFMSTVLPIVGVVGVAVAAVALWVRSVGGLGPAWALVAEKAGAAWALIKDAAMSAWTWITTNFGSIASWIAPLFAGAGIEILATITLIIAAVKAVGAIFTYLKGVFFENYDAIKAVSDGYLTLAGRVLMAIGITKLFLFAAGLVIGVLKALGIVQLATNILWVGWAISLATVKGLVAIVTGVMLVAQAATWLWNGALTVMNILLSPVAILGVVAAIGVLVAILAVAGSALYGLYSAGQQLIGTLTGLSNTTLGTHLSSVFGEWKTILTDVFNLAKSGDFSGAFEMLKLGADLAINQVKDLWPPLWNFIRDGFGHLWTIVSTTFMVEMQRALINVSNRTLDFLTSWDKTGMLTSGLRSGVGTLLNSWNAGLSQSENNVNRSTFALGQMANQFQAVESAATQASRANVEVANLEREYANFFRDRDAADDMNHWVVNATEQFDEFGNVVASSDAASQASRLGAQTGEALATGVKKHAGHAMDSFQAAAVGSAEAIARMNAYRDTFRQMGFSANALAGGTTPATTLAGASTAASPTTLANVVSPPGRTDNTQEHLAVLKDILHQAKLQTAIMQRETGVILEEVDLE